MTRKTLSDCEPALNAAARDILAHDVRYTLASGRRLTVRVQGDYQDGTVNTGVSSAIEQEIELMILKTDLPNKPASGDRLVLPRVPDKMFKPRNIRNDETGNHWLINLTSVAE